MRRLPTADDGSESTTKSTGQMWGEVIFSIVYLIVIWLLVLWMLFQRKNKSSRVSSREVESQNAVEEINEKKERRLGDLFLLAFGLLAFGDSFHLGCRIAGNIKETLKGETVTNIGYGDLFGAITITLFYAVILVIWKERFQEEEKGYGLLGWILFLMVPVRFALMVPPQNDWGTLTPSQPWTSIRNIPLIIQGLSVALLILRDSCPVKDRVYQWFGILIVISYACVIPVVFAGQKYEQLGLLMIPKSIAYVAMALLAYYRYFSRTKAIDISIMHHVHAKILLEGFSPAKANSSELRLPR